MPYTFVAHYSEVALKGKNRPEFVRFLRRNITRALLPFGPDVRSQDGRLVITVASDSDEVASKLSRVFGIAWFASAEMVGADYEQILAASLRTASDSRGSFMIDARRSNKEFPTGSMELARRLGSAVAQNTGMKVDLSNPDLTIHVDVVTGHALVYSARRRGPGGLPVGTAGRSMHLFSGGIDSPVAAWLMLKRGVRPVYLHFYLAPSPEGPMQSKVVKIVKLLSEWGGKSTLVLVPFAEYQIATAEVEQGLEPSLFRRFMRMTAEELAPHFGAAAISSGDSLSQAASQTLWNLGVFDTGSSLPILRPLLSYDKDEIVNLAKRLGTYELSLEEYKDCCAIVTHHPKTRVKPSSIDDCARDLDFTGLVARTLQSASLASLSPATGEVKCAPLSQALS